MLAGKVKDATEKLEGTVKIELGSYLCSVARRSFFKGNFVTYVHRRLFKQK